MSGQEDRLLALPTLRRASCQAPAPSQPVFQGGWAHLPDSVNSSALPSLCRQSAEHPLPLGPGLFGNNGRNIKQGWKTGSESLNSQAGSLEGAGWREGRLGPSREAWRRVGESFPDVLFSPHNRVPPGSACLPAPGKLKFLSHLGCFKKYLGCSLRGHQVEAGGDAEEPLLHKRTQFCPHSPPTV